MNIIMQKNIKTGHNGTNVAFDRIPLLSSAFINLLGRVTSVKYNMEGCWSHYSFNEDQDTESSQGGVFYSKLMGSNTKKPSKVVPFLFSNTNTKLIFQKE